MCIMDSNILCMYIHSSVYTVYIWLDFNTCTTVPSGDREAHLATATRVKRAWEMQREALPRKSARSAHFPSPYLLWEKLADKCPVTYSIAVDVLSVPATSAPSERVFSRASHVLGKNRHNLSDANLEKEVFFKFNAEFLDYGH